MRSFHAAFVPIAAVFSLALISVGSIASAATVTYNTNSPTTGFASGGLTLSGTNGASLAFSALPSTVVGTPTNVNFGIFTLSCSECTDQPNTGSSGSAFFSAFTFHLVVRDETDGGVGTFVGSSTGGFIYRNASPINISWVPLILGPGTVNATSGTFGPTVIFMLRDTNIVAPNSGARPGQTTVEGFISSSTETPVVEGIPEPGSLALFGGGLIGLYCLIRKK
jgi:hypothetical protein